MDIPPSCSCGSIGGLFLITIIETRRSALPLWKGSALAILYHGLETRVRETVEHWDQSSEMEEASKEVRVGLRRDDGVALLRTGVEPLKKAHSIPLLDMRRRNTQADDADRNEEDPEPLNKAQSIPLLDPRRSDSHAHDVDANEQDPQGQLPGEHHDS